MSNFLLDEARVLGQPEHEAGEEDDHEHPDAEHH